MRDHLRMIICLLPLAALVGACSSDGGGESCPDGCPANAHCDDATSACVCNENFVTDDAGGCVPRMACYDTYCRHGTCDDSSGVATCTCLPNFAGQTCAGCVDGYIAYMDGCIPNPCTPLYCGPVENGSCSVGPGGAAKCTCAAGFAGDRCEQCADGFVPLPVEPLECVPNSCDPSPCTHGTCSLDPGTKLAVCACDSGWAAPFCDYHAIANCQLADPTAVTATAGTPVSVAVDVFVESGTAAAGPLEGLTAKACVAFPSNPLNPTDPVNLDVLDCTWPTAFASDAGNNDRYAATLTLNGPSGTDTVYQYVFGVSADGQHWTVCDKNGISTESVAPGTVTVH